MYSQRDQPPALGLCEVIVAKEMKVKGLGLESLRPINNWRCVMSGVKRSVNKSIKVKYYYGMVHRTKVAA